LLASVSIGDAPDPGVRSDLVWERLLTLANRHAVLPLLFRYLVKRPDLDAPPSILGNLRRHVFGVGRRSLELAGELVRLTRVLEAAGMRVIPYKGPTVALQGYGDLSVRQFEDLDFLVPPSDLDRAIAVVQAQGYDLYPRLTPARKRSFYASECECWLANADETVTVELHWSVRERLYGLDPSLEAMFSRCSRLRIAGGTVPGLAPEDLLLVLAAHGIKHAWHRLKWIRDVAGVVDRHPTLDWDAVFQGAARLRAERLVLLPLLLSELLLGLPLPEPVACRAGEHDRRLALDVARLLLATEGEEPSASHRHTLYLRARPALRDRLRYLREVAFTPTMADWDAVHLPDPLFPLYHAVRPIRLLVGRRDEKTG